MKNTRFSVALVYNRKKQLTKNGTALIQIVVTINGQRKYFTTNIYVAPDQWNERQKKIKNHPNAASRNNEIYNKVIEIENFISNLITKGEQPTLLQVENFINEEKTTDFIDFVKKETAKSGYLSKSRISQYKTFAKHLTEYQHGRKLYFDDINYKWVLDFNNFLLAKLDNNTVAAYLRILRKFTMLAINYDLIDYHKNPFKQFKIKVIEKKRDFLTIEEFRKFEKAPADSEQEQFTKDIFIFSCYTGLRYVDIKGLETSDIITSNGETTIYKVQEKTDIVVNIPISSIAGGEALKLLNRYQHGNRYFDLIGLHTIDQYLKKLAAKAGINKNLSFHTARHTNATILLNSGVSITSVQKLLGHKNIKTTMIYAETLAETIKKEVKNIKW